MRQATLADDVPAGTVTELIVEPDDRVLFVGDDMTQQMFYTRAVAVGFLGMMPQANLRFFAGGREAATAGDALEWIDDLLALTNPTVVTVCFGLNDAAAHTDADAAVSAYAQNLAALAQRIKAHASVRRVMLISAPPLQTGIGPDGSLLGQNRTLGRLAATTAQVAGEQGCDFTNLFEHMRNVYQAANQSGGEPLTFAGRLPTEAGHVVVASMVLWGLGVEAQQMEPIGWSPAKPAEMGRIRQTLAIKLSPVTLEQAQACRNLYESIRRHDELFFRAWRVAPRKPSGPDRPQLMAQADQAWAAVLEMAMRVYGRHAPQTVQP